MEVNVIEVHVVTATYGNCSIVRECMESWLPLPVGWKLWVYDSKVSAHDGTREYVRSICSKVDGTCIDDGRNLLHPLAIEQLLVHIKSGWILHLDSDAKLLDRSFYDWVAADPPRSRNKQWGRVTRCEPRMDEHPRGYRLVLPRAFAWLMLVDRGFLLEHELRFDGVGIRGRRDGGFLPKTVPEAVASGKEEIQVFGDTGWQIFWQALGMGVFGEFPDRAWCCWEHKCGASQKWKNINEPQLKQKGLL